jgi:hypothetical protein
MTIQPHEAPESDGVAQAAHLAAMSLTVVEAFTRLRAERLTDGAADDERVASAARAQRLADHAHARVAWARARDHSWLRAADDQALGRVWAAATTWANTDADARTVAARVEQRLHELHPEAMAVYQSGRADGLDPGEAMRRAATLFRQPFAIGTEVSATVDAESAPPLQPRSPQDVAGDAFPPSAERGRFGPGPRPTTAALVITSAPARTRTQPPRRTS